MIIAPLFGRLREHETEMNMMNKQESSEKKVKNIALKLNTKKNIESDEDMTEFSENENLNLLVKKFGRGRMTSRNFTLVENSL